MTKQFKRVKKEIHGVILLDKPTGMSSNRALQQVKHLFQAKKAGHTGSLDPLATGLLPICLGQATKVSQYMLDSHKKYTTTIKLGEVTDTLDSEGEVTETQLIDVSEEQLQTALVPFRGDIKQVPPMYSALKRGGQPLYKLARKGEVVDRPARDMTVYSLQAKRLDECHVELEVHCSSGFYIRSLAHDLGQSLGCGAHVVKLRRTDIKSIAVGQALSLEELECATLKDVLLPIDILLNDMPSIHLNDAQVLNLTHGRATSGEGLKACDVSRFYTPENKLFGLGIVNSEGFLKTHRVFVGID